MEAGDGLGIKVASTRITTLLLLTTFLYVLQLSACNGLLHRYYKSEELETATDNQKLLTQVKWILLKLNFRYVYKKSIYLQLCCMQEGIYENKKIYV